MNTNMQELNLNDLEMVNGGWSWPNFGLGAFVGGTAGGCLVGFAALACSGPVGWCVIGGAAVGAAGLGVYNALQDD